MTSSRQIGRILAVLGVFVLAVGREARGAEFVLQPAKVLLGSIQPGRTARAIVSLELAGEVTATADPDDAAADDLSPPGGAPEVWVAEDGARPPLDVTLLTVAPGVEYELVVRARPPMHVGRHTALIKLRTNLPDQPEIALPVIWSVLGRVAVEPAAVELPSPPSRPLLRPLMFHNYGESPVEILGIEATDPRLKARFEPRESGRAYRIYVEIPAGYSPLPAGPIDADWVPPSVVLLLDDAAKPRLEIPVVLAPGARISGPPAPSGIARAARAQPSPASQPPPDSPGGSRPARNPIAELDGGAAPSISLETTDGLRIATAQPDDDAIVLMFYASWCHFCEQSFPLVQQLVSLLAPRGVRFVAVCEDRPDSPLESQQFSPDESQQHLRALGVSLDQVLDASGDAGRAFGVTAFPTFVAIDRAGAVVWTHRGALVPVVQADLRRTLETGPAVR